MANEEIQLTDLGLSEDTMAWLQAEHQNQRRIWGIQTHSADRWDTILGEEVGELSEAIIEAHYDGSWYDVWQEAVQCATLCIKLAHTANEYYKKLLGSESVYTEDNP